MFFSRLLFNFTDLNGADVSAVRSELKNLLDLDPSIAIPISAKTGKNIYRLIRQIIMHLPPPVTPAFDFNRIDQSSTAVRKNKDRFLLRSLNPKVFRAYIFDSWFELNRGCFLMVRVFNGSLTMGAPLEISSFPQEVFQVTELGVFSPNKEAKSELTEGEVGFVACNLKTPKLGIEALGESVLSLQVGLSKLPAPVKAKPVVFAGIFPDSPDEAELLENCVERLVLEDPAIKCERDTCLALGNGFRCGFLGELHLEIFQQRISDEFGLNTIVTPANVIYEVVVSLPWPFYGEVHLSNRRRSKKKCTPWKMCQIWTKSRTRSRSIAR